MNSIQFVDPNGELLNISVRIDAELKALIPPLKEDGEHREYSTLEQSILSEGCRDAIVVWDEGNVLVDGHNRYEICSKHGLPVKVQFKRFDNRNDVIVWMIKNQFGRRNLTTFQRSELALRLKEVVAAKAKTNQATSTGGFTPQLKQNFAKAEAVNTRETVAEMADVSREQIRKVEAVVKSAPEPIKEAARSGEISTHHAYTVTRALESAPDTAKQKVAAEYAAGNALTVDEVKAIVKRENKDQRISEKQEATRKAILELKDTSDQGVIHADMRTLFETLEDNSVDMFLTDPPYHEEHVELYAELARLAAAKLKPGGLCLAYAGQTFIPRLLTGMGKHLTYWWIFAISHTGGNLAIWQRQIQNEWKPVLVFAKPYSNGKLPVAPEYTVDFVPGGGRDKRYHEWGQDAGEITYWIEKLTSPGDLICDPFVGGGSIPVACKLVGRKWIGTEIDEDNVLKSRLRIAKVNVTEEAINDAAA